MPGNEAGPDMWRALAVLEAVPTLVVRGARSDILWATTARKMIDTLEAGKLVTIRGVGPRRRPCADPERTRGGCGDRTPAGRIAA